MLGRNERKQFSMMAIFRDPKLIIAACRSKWFAGEFLGTFLLVFFGCGSVGAAVTTGAHIGVFPIAVVWGLGYAVATYLAWGLSGAHLNPAVTISLTVWRDFPGKQAALYALAQLAGAFVAAAMLYFIFGDALHLFEQVNILVRGQRGSEASAMMFGEFYPNPSGHPLSLMARLGMSGVAAFGTEMLATAILVLVIFSVTDEENPARSRLSTAVSIGVTLALLISVVGPLTMGCFNPARDLGPRLFSALAGWGTLPFRVNGWGWLTVYILAPILGGVLGGGVYSLWLKKLMGRGEG